MRVDQAVIHERGGAVLATGLLLTTDDARWCDLVCSLAGVAAEGAVYGHFRSGPAKQDLTEALKLAREIRSPQPWNDDWDLSVRSPKFRKMFTPALSTTEAVRLAVAYRMARQLVHAYDLRFYQLISLLLARKKATSTDLINILGHRVVMLIAGMRHARLIVPR